VSERKLTDHERIEARHLLQELSENAKTVRDAMDPMHDVHTITVLQWQGQYTTLIARLQYFTEHLPGGETAPFWGNGPLEWHPGKHKDWREHDGWRRHAHSANGQLTIDPHDSRVHFSGGIPFNNPESP
jgi:hypothetical protein